MINYLNKLGLTSPSQFDFRNKHSTDMALIKLYDTISEAIDRNEFCIGIFIDLSKAFDTINHDIFHDISKLNYYGFRGITNNLLKSYLDNLSNM